MSPRLALFSFCFFYLMLSPYAADPRNAINTPIFYPTTYNYNHINQFMATPLMSYRNPVRLLARPFLAPERPIFEGPPNTWILFNMVCNPVTGSKATLAICQDDLYYLSFKNNTDKWHSVKGYAPIMPDATILSFGGSYPQILPKFPNGTRRSHLDIHDQVPLGKASLEEACQIFSDYNPHTTPESDIQSAFARATVMVAEGQRLRPLNHLLVTQWEGPPFYMPQYLTPFIVNWGALSKMVQHWGIYHSWTGELAKEMAKINVHGVTDAIQILNYMKQRNAV